MIQFTQQKGFVQLIIIVALLVIILSLLGVSLRALFANELLKENFGFIGEWLRWFWNGYLGMPFRLFYEGFVKPFWERFLDALRNGVSFERPTGLAAPPPLPAGKSR